MARKRGTIPGPVSLFRHKLRSPVTLTLTPYHHAKVQRAMQRTKLTRADVVALLIELYADTLTKAQADGYRPVDVAEPDVTSPVSHEAHD